MTPFGSPEAESKLERLLMQGPHDMQVRRALALAYCIRAVSEQNDLGDWESAIELYGRAIAVEGNHPKNWESRANMRSHLASALEMYLWAIEKGTYPLGGFGGPKNEYLMRVAETETPKSIYENSIDDYTIALKCDAVYVPALMGRARVFSRVDKSEDAQSDYQHAQEILSRALEVDSRDLKSLQDQAEALEALGRKKESLESLKELLELETSEWRREPTESAIARLEEELSA